MSRDQVRREQNVSVENRKKTPVGVFDSGVGGLTVAREIARQLPNEILCILETRHVSLTEVSHRIRSSVFRNRSSVS